jgi:hypothetical protein
VRRQSIADQNSRRREDVMEVVKMPSGKEQNKPKAATGSVDRK